MKAVIGVDVLPLLNQKSGIGRSVAGLMSELPSLCLARGLTLVPFFRRFSDKTETLGLDRLGSVRLRLPRKAEGLISKLGLVEYVTGARLFHATDFYIPLRQCTPMIATVHDVIYATQPENNVDHLRISLAMKRHVKQFIRVIACSDFSADEFCSLYGYPRGRVQVIHWGVDLDHFKPHEDRMPLIEGSRPYFLAVSCNASRKNTPRLVRAYICYAAAGGGHDLKLAWTLPDDLAEEVHNAGFADRVKALGKVTEDELLVLYQGAACVMFPSLYEGFGFPILEALACGVPVMTTRRSSLPEVGGDIPVYVDGEDIDEMVQVMWAFECGDMADITQRTRVEGPRRAAQFTWRRCAEQTVETYLSAFAELEAKPWQPLKLERPR